MYVSVWVCMYAYNARVHAYGVRVHVGVHVHVYVLVYVQICICVSMYVCTCMYIFVHVYTIGCKSCTLFHFVLLVTDEELFIFSCLIYLIEVH